MEESEEQFHKISKMIRKEMRRFDAQRVRDLKEMVVQYLESLALTQQQVFSFASSSRNEEALMSNGF